MTRLSAVAAIALALSALSLGSASAQTGRSYLASTGSDTANCLRGTPCRTLQRAHDVTNAKGEIYILDSAGYGAVTITKSISIENGAGNLASAVAQTSSSDAITINAGASDTVSLRGLFIQGFGTGRAGIVFNSGKALIVDKCVVRDLIGRGIDLRSTTSNTNVLIQDTLVSGTGAEGILIGSTSIAPAVMVLRTTVQRADVGLTINNGIAHLIDVVSTSNGKQGLSVFGKTFVKDSTFVRNGLVSSSSGIAGSSGGTIVLSTSVSSQSTGFGVNYGGATGLSSATNMLAGNGATDTTGSATTFALR